MEPARSAKPSRIKQQIAAVAVAAFCIETFWFVHGGLQVVVPLWALGVTCLGAGALGGATLGARRARNPQREARRSIWPWVVYYGGTFVLILAYAQLHKGSSPFRATFDHLIASILLGGPAFLLADIGFYWRARAKRAAWQR